MNCSTSYYFNAQGICTQVNSNCRSNDNLGNCLSCYVGYTLANGNCTISEQWSDSHCARFENNACVACANDSFLNAQTGYCQQISPLCRSSDRNTGACLSCYNGYDLSNGLCVLGRDTIYTDSLCRAWSNGQCRECSTRAYSINGVCTQVDPLCQTFNPTNGFCLSCFRGYNLVDNKCVLNLNNVIPAGDLCRRWNETVCVECAVRSVNISGVCTAVNPLCKTHDERGNCLTCFNGYLVENNGCTLAPQIVNNNNNLNLCLRAENGVCVECATRAYLRDGICV